MRIAIVGGHSVTRGRAPFSDTSWQIWSCSYRNMGLLPRVDVWFELHRLDIDDLLPDDYLDWLARLDNVQIYIQAPNQRFPRGVIFPKDEMVERFGRFFFTSSIAWELALAISRKPKAIGIWGVEQARGDEYRYQRPGTHHFIQVARDQGIEVVVPSGSGLLNPSPLYGYETIGGEQEGEPYRSPFSPTH